jgi:class 3 adenylate cyclase/tetratricopeptide (TPR) repeat protein
VLFADLVGFTSLSESRDAEDTRELLSRYFETCQRLISLYGGTVEKFIGDAVMAVWGTPTATEDDAERAVRAALDLVAAVSALGDEVGASELRARAGVLTGEAAVTLGAERQGMVAGDLVNTAARIQSVADPGAVLVGEATRRATEPTVVYEDAGSHELKGKEGLTPLWKALRVVSGVRGSLKSQGLEAPFVGRDRELRQIKELFHSSAEGRKAHLVSVTGNAGIGKSRLAWEFYKYFDGLAETVWWHRGRCLAYGEGVTYWALADMVRMRCRIGEEEEPASALSKLRSTLEEHVLDAEERSFVEPPLAQLLGLAEHGAADKQDLFAAWRLFFERLSETSPTVLAFEDLQWADASLLDFIEYLFEWSRDHPLFVITLARPELADRRPTWGAGQRSFTALYLEPLSEESMQELLNGLVPGLPEAARGQILTRAEGVPLYAVETVRMLLDRGALVLEGSVYRPVGELGELEVPETLHALIAARLDGLPPEERRLLQDGAVLGKTFTKEALAALSGLDEGQLERLLASLVRKEVLGVQADPRSPEHGQYGFLQDLVRRVAYETLARRERKSRHLAAAAHLEESFGQAEQEVVEVVASHYLAAYEVQPDADDAETIKASARELLTRAGERAGSLAAANEARRYYEQAAELADDPRERAGLLEQAAAMAFQNADYEAAEALYQVALELLEAAGDDHGAARVSGHLAQVEYGTGRIDQALQRLERAFAALSAGERGSDLATVAGRLAALRVFSGAYERAAEPNELALEVAESTRLPEPLGRALMTKALIARRSGRPEEALALLRHALRLALEHDLTESALVAYGNLSDFCFHGDRYGEALEALANALALARRRGDRPRELYVLAETSYALSITGRWQEAFAAFGELPKGEASAVGNVSSVLNGVVEILVHRGRLEEARALQSNFGRLEGSSDLQDRAIFAGSRAALLHAEGRDAEALAAGAEAAGLAADLGAGQQGVKQGLVWAVEAALVLGERERAEELLTTVEGLPPGLRPPMLEAQAHRFRARLHGGEADFKTGAGRFRELEIPFWLAVTELDYGEWLAGEGRAEEAEPLLAEAREIFERLEATPWLARVEAVSRARAEGVTA